MTLSSAIDRTSPSLVELGFNRPEPVRQTSDQAAPKSSPSHTAPLTGHSVGAKLFHDPGSLIRAQQQTGQPGAEQSASAGRPDASDPTADTKTDTAKDDVDSDGLTDAERQEVRRLKARDREVRAHESAHQSAGGGLTGPANFTMTRGPDGGTYAVAGEVPIDTSAEADPSATARKMTAVIRAATAPADPSAQDMRIAAQARQTRSEALAEARSQAADEAEAKAESTTAPSDATPNPAQVTGAYGDAAGLLATGPHHDGAEPLTRGGSISA